MDSNCGRLAKTKSLDTFDVGQKIVIEHCYYYHDIVINSHIPTTNVHNIIYIMLCQMCTSTGYKEHCYESFISILYLNYYQCRISFLLV